MIWCTLYSKNYQLNFCLKNVYNHEIWKSPMHLYFLDLLNHNTCFVDMSVYLPEVRNQLLVRGRWIVCMWDVSLPQLISEVQQVNTHTFHGKKCRESGSNSLTPFIWTSCFPDLENIEGVRLVSPIKFVKCYPQVLQKGCRLKIMNYAVKTQYKALKKKWRQKR